MDSNTQEVEGNQQDEWNQDTIDQFESDLNTVEAILTRHLEALKTVTPTDLQEDTPPQDQPTPKHPLLHTTQRVMFTLKRCVRAEEFIKKENNNLKKQLKDQQFMLEQVELERDVLLQQVHAYLETNSSLRIRLEEQRCQSGSLQKQANASLELRIKSLENDKEQLNDSNMEKDKQIHRMAVMLEQTTKCLRNRETEVHNRKNEENNLVTLLKADLRKALEEKADLEERYSIVKERLEDYCCGRNGRAVNSRLKRSLSAGDVNYAKVTHREKNILLEPPSELHLEGEQMPKSTHKAEPNQVDNNRPTPWRLHASRSWPLPQTTTDRSKSTPVHTQLNALRRDLVNVTRKLDALKSQLTVSGVIAEEENRSLKRKAKPMEETEDEGISGGYKSEFKNLRNILQDAKNLNAKLQNMREEKQRIIDKNKEKGGRSAEKTNEHFGPREFQNAVLELKKAVNECEEKFDGGDITEEEAFAGLVSPVFSCILSNLGCYSEWRRRTTGGAFSDDTESLTDETSAGEDGGGDNPLKMLGSTEHCKESKSQGARVNLKMDHPQKV